MERVSYTWLGKVHIPSGVVSLSGYIFWKCNALQTVGPSDTSVNYNITYDWTDKIPQYVKYFGKNAFKGCSNLKTVNLNDGLEEIGAEPGSTAADYYEAITNGDPGNPDNPDDPDNPQVWIPSPYLSQRQLSYLGQRDLLRGAIYHNSTWSKSKAVKVK